MAGPLTVVAHHAYEPQRDDELKFDEGETILVTDSSDPDWWVGKKDDGTSGFFPSNFVNAKQGTSAATEEAKNDTSKPATEEPKALSNDEEQEQKPSQDEAAAEEAAAPSPPPAAKPIGMARVMEDYAMQESDELTLHRGDIITLYERLDDGWFKGEINGRSGRFPSQYVEEIDMPGRPDFGAHAAPVATKPEEGAEGAEPSKPAFKLAAYGVKQGGIGSLLAGGFPALKKTAGSAGSPTAKKPPVPEAAPAPVPAPAPAQAPAVPAQEKPSVPEPTQAEPEKKYIGKAIVLHPYEAENEDELSLLRGEYVSVIDKDVDDGWWKGTTERGNTGVFPSNFVKEIEEETMASPPPVRSRKSVTSAGSQHSLGSAAASSQVGATIRAPPLPGKSSRPPSVASVGGRPESVHDSPTASTATAIPEEPAAAAPAATPSPPPAAESPAAATPPTEESEKNEPTAPAPTSEEPKAAEQPSSPPVPQRPASIASPAIPERPPSVSSPSIPERPPSDVAMPPAVPGRPPVVSSRPSSTTSDATSPAIPKRPSAEAPERSPSSSDASPPPQQSPPIPEEEDKAMPVQEKPDEHKEDEHPPAVSSPAESPSSSPEEPVKVAATQEEESAKPVAVDETKAESAAEEAKEEREAPQEEPAVDTQEKEVEKEAEPSASEATAESPKEEQAQVADEQQEQEDEEEQKKAALDLQPTGPKLTAPSRARPGRARRAPETRKDEPSQMEMLKQQLAEAPAEEEPKKETAAASPPAKPAKPIFAKFPTPFAGGAAPELKSLKPVQRRMFEPAPAHESSEADKKEGDEPPRPTGVRNIASRFNVPSSGGNEVLETKMKNFTRNEIEKTRKDLERQLGEEREKRTQLEQLVASLADQVQQLQSQLGQQ